MVDDAHSVATVRLLGAVAAGVGSRKATGICGREFDHRCGYDQWR
jgi:hypothetical protein